MLPDLRFVIATIIATMAVVAMALGLLAGMQKNPVRLGARTASGSPILQPLPPPPSFDQFAARAAALRAEEIARLHDRARVAQLGTLAVIANASRPGAAIDFGLTLAVMTHSRTPSAEGADVMEVASVASERVRGVAPAPLSAPSTATIPADASLAGAGSPPLGSRVGEPNAAVMAWARPAPGEANGAATQALRTEALPAVAPTPPNSAVLTLGGEPVDPENRTVTLVPMPSAVTEGAGAPVAIGAVPLPPPRRLQAAAPAGAQGNPAHARRVNRKAKRSTLRGAQIQRPAPAPGPSIARPPFGPYFQ